MSSQSLRPISDHHIIPAKRADTLTIPTKATKNSQFVNNRNPIKDNATIKYPNMNITTNTAMDMRMKLSIFDNSSINYFVSFGCQISIVSVPVGISYLNDSMPALDITRPSAR